MLAGIGTALGLAALSLVAAPMPATAASAATLQQINDFGANPGNLQMYLYVPSSAKPHPAILVAMHGCSGSGPAFYQGTEFRSLADRYGFVVIYPSATHSYGRQHDCFDVWTSAALHHNGGSDPVSIVSMVSYVEQHYGGNPHRVFATGFSSGAMETNNLLAVNPEVFKAGAPFSGVPYGCFSSGGGCNGGSINKTPQQWGDLVRSAYPATPGRGRACSRGTAPRTPCCPTRCCRPRSTSGRTCSASARPRRRPTIRSRPGPVSASPTRTVRSRSRRTASRVPVTACRNPAWRPTRSTSSVWTATPPRPRVPDARAADEFRVFVDTVECLHYDASNHQFTVAVTPGSDHSAAITLAP
jgi:poly(hydroxyalkanoate) depolymerase family esterase